MMPPRIRILCVDDHQLLREGLGLILERESDMEVVAFAATGEKALDLFETHRPDIVLMDLQLPGMNGLEAIHVIRRRHPDAHIIVLTMFDGEEDIYRALAAGAATYLLKDTLSKDLIRVIRGVAAGAAPLDPVVWERLAHHAQHPALTTREVEVVEQVAVGHRNKEIAAFLGISEETVRMHLKNIFVKLDVNDRTAAVNVALRRGIIHIN
jgi:two-component system, NarL family, response regulator